MNMMNNPKPPNLINQVKWANSLKYKQPKLTEGGVGNLISSISIKEIQIIVKHLAGKKPADPDGCTREL